MLVFRVSDPGFDQPVDQDIGRQFVVPLLESHRQQVHRHMIAHMFYICKGILSFRRRSV